MPTKYLFSAIAGVALCLMLLGCDAEKIGRTGPKPPDEAPFGVDIDYIHDQLQGHYAEISISADSVRGRLSAYTFFLSYDPAALTFIGADPGDLLQAEGWDLFDYQRYTGDQIDSSHLAFVHLYAVKDMPLIDIPPDSSVPPSNELADLEFYVTNDRAYECTFQAIRFYWRDCDDNVLYTLDGDTVAFVENVYDTARSVAVADSMYIDGWHGPSEDCFAALHHVPVPMIDFINGGITIICSGPLDPSGNGDINANGLPFEIADAVIFINYFVYGLAAFGSHAEASSLASDVNFDGNPLTVADLVFINRIIVGDANPHLQVRDSASLMVMAEYENDLVTVTTQSDSTIGAMYMIFDATAAHGWPWLNPSSDEMYLKFNTVNDSLRVLIYDIGDGSIASGTSNVLTIPASDTMRLLYAEAATYYGMPMKTTIDGVPQQFELGQNYPNPFSSSTTIALSLPEETDWSVTIFTVEADTVRQYSGHSYAGVTNIEWDGTWQDGTPAADGVYFYRAVAGEFTATRKMMLVH